MVNLFFCVTKRKKRRWSSIFFSASLRPSTSFFLPWIPSTMSGSSLFSRPMQSIGLLSFYLSFFLSFLLVFFFFRSFRLLLIGVSCGGRDSPPPPPTASFSWPAATTRNVEKEKKKYTRVEINKVKNKREKNNKPQATHASQQQQQQEQQMKSFSWFSLSLSLCLSPSLPGPFFRSSSTFQSLRDCYRVFFLSSAPSATGGRRVALGRRRRLLWATPVDLKKNV